MQKMHIALRNAVCAIFATTGQLVPKWNKLNYPEIPDNSKNEGKISEFNLF